MSNWKKTWWCWPPWDRNIDSQKLAEPGVVVSRDSILRQDEVSIAWPLVGHCKDLVLISLCLYNRFQSSLLAVFLTFFTDWRNISIPINCVFGSRKWSPPTSYTSVSRSARQAFCSGLSERPKPGMLHFLRVRCSKGGIFSMEGGRQISQSPSTCIRRRGCAMPLPGVGAVCLAS